MEIKQQSKMHESVCHVIAISSNIINERFEELILSTNIIGERSEKSTQENSEETDSDVVSFRNSKSNEDQTVEDNTDFIKEDYSSSYEESNSHKELCTYISNRVSK